MVVGNDRQNIKPHRSIVCVCARAYAVSRYYTGIYIPTCVPFIVTPFIAQALSTKDLGKDRPIVKSKRSNFQNYGWCIL